MSCGRRQRPDAPTAVAESGAVRAGLSSRATRRTRLSPWGDRGRVLPAADADGSRDAAGSPMSVLGGFWARNAVERPTVRRGSQSVRHLWYRILLGVVWKPGARCAARTVRTRWYCRTNIPSSCAKSADTSHHRGPISSVSRPTESVARPERAPLGRNRTSSRFERILTVVPYRVIRSALPRCRSVARRTPQRRPTRGPDPRAVGAARKSKLVRTTSFPPSADETRPSLRSVAVSARYSYRNARCTVNFGRFRCGDYSG